MDTKSTREQTPRITTTARPVAGRPTGGTGWTGRDLAKILRRRVGLILLCLLVITAITVGGTYLWIKMWPQYSAVALLQVDRPQDSYLSESRVGLNADILERYKRSYAMEIQSEQMIRLALDRPAVRQTQWYVDHRTSDMNEATLELMDELKVVPVPESELIQIRLAYVCRTAKERAELPTLVNALMDVAYEQLNERYGNDMAGSVTQLEEQERSLASQIQTLQTSIADQLRLSPTPMMQQRVDSLTFQVQALTSELVRLEMEAAQADSAVKMLEGQIASGEIRSNIAVQQQVQFDPLLRQLELQMAMRQTELNITRERYGDDHRTVQRIGAEIESAKKEIEDRTNRLLDDATSALRASYEGQRDAVTQQLLEARRRLEMLSSNARDAASAMLEIDRLQRLQDDLKAQLLMLQGKRIDFQLASQSQRMRPVKVIRRATVPIERSWPKWQVMVPVGVLLGLMVGVGLAFLLEMIDTSVKTPSDITRRVDMPLLAMVPHGDDLAENIDDFRRALLTAPQSLVGEAYRELRTNLLFSGPASQRRTLLVTSPSPSDGRTSVAVSLAVAVAHSGRRVLLIDANFRRPSVRHLFPEVGEAGLSDALSAQQSWRECAADTSLPNLAVMSSGKMPPNPNELLGSDLARTIFTEMAAEYDQVIFDGPPLLLISDAAVLATMVDGVVLVVRAGSNTYGIVQRSRDTLARLGAHTLGVVLNGVRTSAGGYLRKNYDTFYQYQESGS